VATLYIKVPFGNYTVQPSLWLDHYCSNYFVSSMLYAFF